MHTFLAVDIGASSGRHIVGQVENGAIRLTEVYRFPNGAVMGGGQLRWDVEALTEYVIAGLVAAREKGFTPAFIGIDTWAVDYVLLDEQLHMLGDCVAYRDDRTVGMDAELEKTLPFAKHFALTGIAKQPFNTVYQLMAHFRKHPEHKAQAAHFLMMPDYLAYRLTGKMQNEYTNASSTAMLNAKTRTWDKTVLQAADIPEHLFSQAPVAPCAALGTLADSVRERVGYDATVLLPATHDTGSAFLAVPARDANAVTLSSGTWSLLGVENREPLCDEQSLAAGFTNEGGYDGTYRYLKNIMGLWILQCVRREMREQFTFAEMADMAREERDYPARIPVNDARFLAPMRMIDEIEAALSEQGYQKPTHAQLLSCVHHSLAECYAEAIAQLEKLTGRQFTSVNIVGGGSQNRWLDQLTANATGLPVYAGPTEGTALGNLMAQMLHAGEFSTVQQARNAVRDSFDIAVYEPQR